MESRQLATLVLAVLRAIEALGKAGIDANRLESVAETAIDLLPRTGRGIETDPAGR